MSVHYSREPESRILVMVSFCISISTVSKMCDIIPLITFVVLCRKSLLMSFPDVFSYIYYNHSIPIFDQMITDQS